jgi:hypothetical protein
VSNSGWRHGEGDEQAGGGNGRQSADVQRGEAGCLRESVGGGFGAWEGEKRRERLRGESVGDALVGWVC